MQMIKMNLLTNDEVIVNLRWFITRTGEDFQYIDGELLKEILEEISDKGTQPIYYATYRTIFEDRTYGVISDQPLVGNDLKNILESCDHRCSTCEEYYNDCEFRISNEERKRLIKLADERKEA